MNIYGYTKKEYFFRLKNYNCKHTSVLDVREINGDTLDCIWCIYENDRDCMKENLCQPLAISLSDNIKIIKV